MTHIVRSLVVAWTLGWLGCGGGGGGPPTVESLCAEDGLYPEFVGKSFECNPLAELLLGDAQLTDADYSRLCHGELEPYLDDGTVVLGDEAGFDACAEFVANATCDDISARGVDSRATTCWSAPAGCANRQPVAGDALRSAGRGRPAARCTVLAVNGAVRQRRGASAALRTGHRTVRRLGRGEQPCEVSATARATCSGAATLECIRTVVGGELPCGSVWVCDRSNLLQPQTSMCASSADRRRGPSGNNSLCRVLSEAARRPHG
jgi:hypothetical protein